MTISASSTFHEISKKMNLQAALEDALYVQLLFQLKT